MLIFCNCYVPAVIILSFTDLDSIEGMKSSQTAVSGMNGEAQKPKLSRPTGMIFGNGTKADLFLLLKTNSCAKGKSTFLFVYFKRPLPLDGITVPL